MRLRSSLPLSLATVTSCVLAASMFAQQVPNPVLPGPSGTGDGLTRDALDAPTPTPAPASVPATRPTASTRRATQRTAKTSASARKKTTYATINHRHRRHRAKRREAVAFASNRTIPARRHEAAKPRPPLVSFIYWWNGWVMRTFHTRSGTVLLDTVGAKS